MKKIRKIPIKSPKVKRGLLLAAKIFAGLLALVLVLWIGAMIFMQTEPGRETARKGLNKLISTQLRGTFEIQHIDKIGFSKIEARGLIITAAVNGRKVIELNQVTLNPRWSRLLLGRIQGSEATVDGGVVRLKENDEKIVDLIDALSSPKPKHKRGDPIYVLFENIRGRNIDVKLDIQGFPPFEVKDISTLIRLELKKKARIRLNETNAHMEFPVLGDTKIRGLSGVIRAKTIEVLELDLKIELGDLVPMHLEYHVPKNEQKPGKPKLFLEFSEEKSPGSFTKLLLKMADAISPVIDVDFGKEEKKSDESEKSEKQDKPDKQKK